MHMILGKEDAANNYARGHYTIGIFILFELLCTVYFLNLDNTFHECLHYNL